MSSQLQAKPTDLVASLQRLSKTVGLHQPSSFKARSPTIILATWMNAAPRRISFYIQRHIDLFPDARIIRLQGIIPNMVYSPEATQKVALQPVLDALLAEPESPVFIHLFSNSGAQQTGLLLRAYKDKTGNALPVKGMFFDSTPSIGTFSRAYTGLSYEIPKRPWWIRIPGLLVVAVVIAIVWLIGKISGRLNVIAQGNHDLLDKSLIDQSVERWYLYSVED